MKEAYRTASSERRSMLNQHKEIERIRQTTSKIWSKLGRHKDERSKSPMVVEHKSEAAVSTFIFRHQVYSLGSVVIALVRLSVFKYLRDRSLVFSETLHEVRGQLSKKSDMAEILKKNLNPGIKGD